MGQGIKRELDRDGNIGEITKGEGVLLENGLAYLENGIFFFLSCKKHRSRTRRVMWHLHQLACHPHDICFHLRGVPVTRPPPPVPVVSKQNHFITLFPHPQAPLDKWTPREKNPFFCLSGTLDWILFQVPGSHSNSTPHPSPNSLSTPISLT